MGLARLYSRALRGVEAPEVIVEVHIANGLPAFSMVGLPDVEVKESTMGINSKLSNQQFLRRQKFCTDNGPEICGTVMNS